jgi:oxygen-independent coproporphyrinogen-3 oxidase
MKRASPGIYIHLPFCKAHCSYCDFPITTQLSLSQEYGHALLGEIAHRPVDSSADTLYFGGGTPSLASIRFLAEIFSLFPLEKGAEITLEANPDDITSEKLQGWLDTGVNRLSIGVQSLENSALSAAGRIHSSEQAIQALEHARKSGFTNINVDLMIGLPQQTVDGFLNDLSRLVEFAPAHFSVYMLEVHEKTSLFGQFQRGERKEMPEEDQLACYEEAIRLLEKAGYEQYEVSNFARPGYRCKHNLKYWTSAPYYGYGTGACSYVNSWRIENVPSVPVYIQRIKEGCEPVLSSMLEDRDTRMRNTLIFGLRKIEGIRPSEFQAEYEISPLTLFPENGRILLEEELLEMAEDHLRLTRSGMIVSNEVLSLVV